MKAQGHCFICLKTFRLEHISETKGKTSNFTQKLFSLGHKIAHILHYACKLWRTLRILYQTHEKRTIFCHWNHISPHFSILIINALKQIFEILWSYWVKMCLNFICIKEICFCEKLRTHKQLKISGQIWSPGEIWFFALHVLFFILPLSCGKLTCVSSRCLMPHGRTGGAVSTWRPAPLCSSTGWWGWCTSSTSPPSSSCCVRCCGPAYCGSWGTSTTQSLTPYKR